MQTQLISQLSPTLAEKVISINERGLTSADWVVYNNSTKRTRYSSVPTSDITAETVVADGRINSAGFLHSGDEKQFGYGYLSGSNLLQTLTSATVNSTNYGYDYDHIGNRITAEEGESSTVIECSYDTHGRRPPRMRLSN